MKMFLEKSVMNNKLRAKEVIEKVTANCAACNRTGKVAKIRNFLIPRTKDFNDLVAINLAKWTDPKQFKKFYCFL